MQRACGKRESGTMLDNLKDQVTMDEQPCMQCKKCMPVEWLGANCPCIMLRMWEHYMMHTKYK
jgi:hypothetical protein